MTGATPPQARLTVLIPSPPAIDRMTNWFYHEDTVPIAEGDLDIEHDIVVAADVREEKDETAGASVTGVVADAVTEEPLAGWRVIGGSTAGLSDARGRFAVRVAGDGTYVLQARADGMRGADMAGLLESESVAVVVESGRVASPASIVIHVTRGPSAKIRLLRATGGHAGGVFVAIGEPRAMGGHSAAWTDAAGLVTLYANATGVQPALVASPDGPVTMLDVAFGSDAEQVMRLPHVGAVRATLAAGSVVSVKHAEWPRALTMHELQRGCPGCAWRDIDWDDGYRRIEFRALPIGQVELSAGPVTRTVLVREDAPTDADLR